MLNTFSVLHCILAFQRLSRKKFRNVIVATEYAHTKGQNRFCHLLSIPQRPPSTQNNCLELHINISFIVSHIEREGNECADQIPSIAFQIMVSCRGILSLASFLSEGIFGTYLQQVLTNASENTSIGFSDQMLSINWFW